MKLAIISHTEHYNTTDGTIVGWGPTVMEINHLLEVFEEIYHVAMLHQGEAPPSALPYQSGRIHFVPIPAVGGPSFSDKLSILWYAPKIVSIISIALKKVDVFQFRAPTGIGVYVIPYLTFFVKKKGWYKYAGNWNQKQAPPGYALQRWLLKHQARKVTINGFWEHQPANHLSFENPCLSEADIRLGEQVRLRKDFIGKLSFCFVGRLEREKGVERIIRAFLGLNKKDLDRVETVHLVGAGKALENFKTLAQAGEIDFKFHGTLARKDVFKVYTESHVFLLPTTASEGFPKVIAEALNFGCVPIVSRLSAIDHYIGDEKNGYLIDPVTDDVLGNLIKKLLYLSEVKRRAFLDQAPELVKQFTFEHYNQRIVNDILNTTSTDTTT
ncbi:glycosyltransferase [Aestuariivivens sediminicola]|uniref:glycosyltransferase n=1 Tax=Aestuariivivens sediminicola TaxID=2913560 RepID=UPI001F562472|nr:glycosyltransferase [Aestuariivivens sediminicola]